MRYLDDFFSSHLEEICINRDISKFVFDDGDFLSIPCFEEMIDDCCFSGAEEACDDQDRDFFMRHRILYRPLIGSIFPDFWIAELLFAQERCIKLRKNLIEIVCKCDDHELLTTVTKAKLFHFFVFFAYFWVFFEDALWEARQKFAGRIAFD